MTPADIVALARDLRDLGAVRFRTGDGVEVEFLPAAVHQRKPTDGEVLDAEAVRLLQRRKAAEAEIDAKAIELGSA